MLSDAAVAGNLEKRADADQHKGDYQKIIEGMNNMMDAVARPLDNASAQLALIADGAAHQVLDTNEYNGDFKKIIISLNHVSESLFALVEDTGSLVEAAVEGKLSVRADASRHKGGYRRIIQGGERYFGCRGQPDFRSNAGAGRNGQR